MNLSLVIFDFDGTIIDSREGIFNCLRHALASIGLEAGTEEDMAGFIGPPLLDVFKQFYLLDDETSVQLLNKYRARYREEGFRECRVYDGMYELLEELRARGVKTAVASTKPGEFVTKICAELKMEHLFDALIGPSLEESNADKSRLLERAFACAGGLSKKETVMVGDSKYDILAAKKTGMLSIGVEYGFGTREELLLSGADKIVKDLSQLRDCLMSF